MERDRQDIVDSGDADRDRLIELLLRREGIAAAPAAAASPDLGGALLASERQVWFLTQLAPGSTAYNIGFAYRLPAPADWAALRRSLASTIERHPALRTTFDEVDGLPVRRVAPRTRVAPLLIDLREVAVHARRRELDRILSSMTWTRYRPDQRLWRVAVIETGDDRPVLWFGFHHLIVDGWSAGVFLRDISAAYTATRGGTSIPPAARAATPAELAARQQEWLNGPHLTRHLAYWRDLLMPLREPTQIPFAVARAPHTSRTPPAGFSVIQLDPPLVAALRARSREEGSTTVNVLLAALAIQLWRYSREDDIRIGMVSANRAMAGAEHALAFLANTLLLRVAITGDLTARAVIDRVRRVTLESWAHQQCPFDRVAQEIDPHRDLTAHPLISVMFVHYVGGLERLEWEGRQTERIPIAPRHAKFDVTLTAVESAEGIELRCEYRSDLFTPSAVATLLDQYATVLEVVATSPDARVATIPLMDAAATAAAWLSGERAPDAAGVATVLHARVAAVAAQRGDAVAAVSEDAHLTYGALVARAAGVAAALRGYGVGPEQHVAVIGTPDLALLVGLVGVLAAGAAYVPIDPQWPAARIAAVLADAAVVAVVGGTAAEASLAGGLPYVAVEHVTPQPPGAWTGWPEQAAYVLYTSGSTGMPKGVVVTHGNVGALLTALAAPAWGGAAGVWTLCHAATFDFSVWEMWGAWAQGARLVIVPYWTRRDPAALTRLLVDEQVTVFNQTPSAWRQWLAHGGAEHARLALAWVLFGGEALGPEHVAAWWRLPRRATTLVNLYGITETTVHVTWRPLAPTDATHAARQPIGGPLPHLDLYVWDAAQQPAAVGTIGELWVGGAGVARGYWGAPALTADRFRPHPRRAGERVYRSGDLARRLPDGEVDYVGRADQQVKVRGVRIERGEVEAALAACPGVRDAVVVSTRDAHGESQLVAYVVPAHSPAPPAAQLRATLAQQLPAALMPTAFVSLTALPLTANGKLDTRALPPPGDTERPSAGEYAGPRTAFEEAVADIWRDALGRDFIPRDQDFFEAGGNSLQATLIVARLRKLFGIGLSVRAMFDARTIARLAQDIAATRGHARKEPTLRVCGRTSGPLTFAQSRLWIAEKLAGAAPVFVVSGAWRLTGNVDAESLAAALSDVIGRHAALRTGFGSRDGKPEQRVFPAPAWRLTLTDLKAVPEPLRSRELAHRRWIQASRPFDLGQPPLFRAELVRVGADEAVLIWSVHHLVFDGWSRRILWEDVSASYAARIAGKTPHLPALRLQPLDVAWWERESTGAYRDPETLAYWAERLEHRPPRLRLGAAPLADDDRYCADVVSTPIADDVMLAAAGFAAAEGATLFMVMYAAFVALLFRYTGMLDITVGTPVSTRAFADAETLIGYFLNMLVLRMRATPATTFRALLSEARETCLGAYTHADALLEHAPGALAVSAGSGARARLVDIVFTLADDEKRTALRVPDVSVTELEPLVTAGEYDLSLLVKRSGGSAEAILLFRTSRFDRDSMREFVENYTALLAAATREPEEAIAHLHLASVAAAGQTSASRV